MVLVIVTYEFTLFSHMQRSQIIINININVEKN